MTLEGKETISPDTQVADSAPQEEAVQEQAAEVASALAATSRTRMNGQGVQRLISALVIIAGVVVWQLVTMFQLVSPLYLPTPVSVLQNLQTLITIGLAQKTLFDDVWISVARVGVGFLAAVAIGVPVGILMGWNDVIFKVIDPFIQFIRPVPPLAYIPLLVVWLGIGEVPKVVLILIGTLPVIIISTVSGVRGTPIQRIRVAQCLGANPLQLFFHTILPSALPEIFTGMRVGIGVAWSCLVAAELIAADAGLGWLVEYAGQNLQVGIIFVGIIAIGLSGYLMELIIRALESLAVPWKGRA
jgi:NitT/TauT family transport system permease protein/taurine transport system permease protein